MKTQIMEAMATIGITDTGVVYQGMINYFWDHNSHLQGICFGWNHEPTQQDLMEFALEDVTKFVDYMNRRVNKL